MTDFIPSFLKGSDGKFSLWATIGAALVILAVVALGFRVKPIHRLIAGG